MFERFTEGARAAVETHAVAEARRRGDRRVGTEHLLLGTLHDPDAAGPFGAGVEQARAALEELDTVALLAIGIDTSGVERTTIPEPAKRLAFTSGAKAALTRALVVARKARARRVTSAHLLLGLLDSDRADPATDVLAQLGVEPARIRARLLTSTGRWDPAGPQPPARQPVPGSSAR